MSLRTAVARFTKGLVSDELAVGALLEADDVVPIVPNLGWRTRGGKRLVSPGGSVTSASYQGSPLMPSPAGAGSPILVGVGTMAGPFPSPYVWDATLGTTLLLPRQALNAAGSGVAFTHISNTFDSGASNARFGDEMWVLPKVGGTTAPWRYGGAYATTTQYATGTLATTAGSNVLTGTGTSWASGSNLRVGQYIAISHASTTDRLFRVTRINSATSVTVDRVLPMTASGLSYRALNNTWWSVKPGIFGSLLSNVAVTSLSTMMARVCCQHQGRMFVAGTIDADNILRPDRVRWSAAQAETDALSGGTGMWGGAEYFQSKAYIDVYPGEGGSAGIKALASFGGQLFVFKAAGVYVIRGAFESDGRDTGASVEVITSDDGLVGSNVVVTGEGIYWAGKNGLYLMTGSSLVNLTDRAKLREFYVSTANAFTVFGSPTPGWSIRGWTGERLILQCDVSRDDARLLRPNTLVYYPRLGLWCTQTTFNTTTVLSASNTLNANDEIAVGASNDLVAGGYGVRWSDDNNFSTGFSSTAPNTFHGRAEFPLMKLTTHPIMLDGGLNARVRAASVKAKVRDDVGTGVVVEADVVFGEQGTTSGPEGEASAQSFSGVLTDRTEGWQRLANREGSPPVDSVRVRLLQTLQSFDCRVYEMEVEHVTVARTRS